MPQAATGLTLSLEDAKKTLTDIKGKQLEFTEQKDGTWTAKEVEGDSYVYQYSLVPQPVIVTVSVAKISKEEKKKKTVTAEEAPKPKKTY